MRSVLLLTLLLGLCASPKLNAFAPIKTSELGLQGGISYYTGELNYAKHFNPNFIQPSFGLFYRRNFNSRWAFRLSGNYAKVSGNDLFSNGLYYKDRGLKFESTLVELAGTIEFNFFPFSAQEDQGYSATPFIFIGIAPFFFSTSAGINSKALFPAEREGQNYLPINVAIPFGLGYKLKLNQRVFVGIEYGLRKTFTDYIDDVSTVYPSSGFQRGNSRSKDFYAIAALNISFRLGRKFTNCAFDQSKAGRWKKGSMSN